MKTIQFPLPDADTIIRFKYYFSKISNNGLFYFLSSLWVPSPTVGSISGKPNRSHRFGFAGKSVEPPLTTRHHPPPLPPPPHHHSHPVFFLFSLSSNPFPPPSFLSLKQPSQTKIFISPPKNKKKERKKEN